MRAEVLRQAAAERSQASEANPVVPVLSRRSLSGWLFLGAALAAAVAAAVLLATGLGAERAARPRLDQADRLAALGRALDELHAAAQSDWGGRLTQARGVLRQVQAAGSGAGEVLDTAVRVDALLTQAERRKARVGQGSEGGAADLVAEASVVVRATEARLLTAVAGDLDRARRRTVEGIAVILLTVVLTLLVAAVMWRRLRGAVAEEGLQQLSSLLAAAVRSTEEGILITDTGMTGDDPRIVFLNRSFGEMIGRVVDDLVGKPLKMLREVHLQEREFSLLEHSFSNSRSATMETVRWREDGSSLHCEWHISPVRDGEGRVTHFVSVLRDITERRQHEAALERTARELADANRKLKENQAQLIQSEKMAFLGQLAAGVAHEINNPVGYVMSNLETVGEDVESLAAGAAEAGGGGNGSVDLAQLREMLSESRSGLEQVRDIVARLKNFARPDEAAPEPANVNELLEGSLRIVWNELKHKCTVRKNLGDLPEIMCRPGQISQVFTNLLMNAAQAIPEQGIVTLSSGVERGEVVVSVADTGVGIPREHMAELFTPFFTTKPVGQGTGLGLAVSYGIVNAHGGRIEVESSPGSGSRFTVRLPIVLPDAQQRTSPGADVERGGEPALDLSASRR